MAQRQGALICWLARLGVARNDDWRGKQAELAPHRLGQWPPGKKLRRRSQRTRRVNTVARDDGPQLRFVERRQCTELCGHVLQRALCRTRLRQGWMGETGRALSAWREGRKCTASPGTGLPHLQQAPKRRADKRALMRPHEVDGAHVPQLGASLFESGAPPTHGDLLHAGRERLGHAVGEGVEGLGILQLC